MAYKRILTIQDISCVGQCSLTVALPIISACGMETAVLPSAVLSTHTGGFTGYTFRDLTDDIPAIAKHWNKEGLYFDAIYTGYLGSTRQIDMVKDIFATALRDGGMKIVDPAMADGGKLYPGFDAPYVEAMKSLCADADIVIPNITEAAMLTGLEYREKYDEKYIDALIEGLEKLGAKSVVITGVSYGDDTTGVVTKSGSEKNYYEHKKLKESCHGTGDVYASAFVGAMANGKSIANAAKIAADFTLECMLGTVGDDSHKYGVKFEPQLGGLIRSINE